MLSRLKFRISTKISPIVNFLKDYHRRSPKKATFIYAISVILLLVINLKILSTSSFFYRWIWIDEDMAMYKDFQSRTNSFVRHRAKQYVKEKRVALETYPEKKFPKIVVIGAAKCGTTATVNFLNLHPKIKKGPETYFFNRNPDYTASWYLNKMPDSSEDEYVIEHTPTLG